MENLMSQCTNETTQTTMDTTLTTTFGILAKTLMHTIYNLQREQPVYRFKAKTLISLSTNETTQTTIFSIDNKNVLAVNVKAKIQRYKNATFILSVCQTESSKPKKLSYIAFWEKFYLESFKALY